MLLVTGGAGFIGSNFIQQLLNENKQTSVVNLDKLTYAGNLANLTSVEKNERYTFVEGDITDSALVAELLATHKPTGLLHFAAESHVDRSIYAPTPFLETNVVGTTTLLDSALNYWRGLSDSEQKNFRFIHISTDEVYGSLAPKAPSSVEESRFAPNSPYAASKASGDCFARAYHKTYGLPVIITRSSNNYGPYQFPEKLIPLTILNALFGKAIPIYGNGKQLRNWLYVEDHCRALQLILEKGTVGASYNIAEDKEKTNIAVVEAIVAAVEAAAGPKLLQPPSTLITHVQDRPGHDIRYSLDSTKLRRELGWKPKASFSENITTTVSWYLEKRDWLVPLLDDDYKAWIELNYGGMV